MSPRLSLALAAAMIVPAVATAGDASAKNPAPAAATHSHRPNWLTGEGVSLGGVLFPHIHFNSVYGGTTADELPEIGHHDPREDGWTIQGFEFGSSLRWSDWFEGYGNLHLNYDNEAEEWNHEFEEWFGKIKNLPGGFELRGGRYLNRFGFQNSTHLHGWDFVDSSLVNGRFLGDDGLYTIGGEVSWKLPVPWTSELDVSVGVVPDREGHEHSEEKKEHLYEAEGALFDDTIVTANWTNQFDYNDFHQLRAGLSGAWGDNVWGRTNQVYGVHFQYEWRENGYEAGGRYFRWRTELMLRKFGAVSGHLPGEEEEAHEHEAEEHAHHEDEHDHKHAEEEEHEEEVRRAELDEMGLYTALTYGFDNGLEFGLRGEYVGGIADAGLDERYRLSPAITYYLNRSRTFYVRTQYNYDHSNDFGSEHSVWAQFGINWGGPHVR